MGLDKWLKTDDVKDGPKKKKLSSEQVKTSKERRLKNQVIKKNIDKLVKYILVCQNKKCNYQKVIVKKQLAEQDKICPRCNKQMKIKES